MKRDSDNADGRPGAARRVLNPGEPDPLLRYEFDRGSNYEHDARVTEALLALVPEDELIGPDHRFFQVVHLVTEYTWAAMHHEMRRAVRAMGVDDHLLAAEALDRAAGLGAVPVSMVRLMSRHLPQFNLLTMREAFPPNTTGLDSPGARNLRRASLALWRAFETALDRHGVTLADLTAAPRAEAEGRAGSWELRGLTAVRDGLHRLDLTVQEWKQVHLRMVWTQLGGHPYAGPHAADPDGPEADEASYERGELPTSLRGRPISDLERMAQRALFPLLWHEADLTFRAFAGSSYDEDRSGRPAVP